MSALSYSPGASKMTTYLHCCTSITRLEIGLPTILLVTIIPLWLFNIFVIHHPLMSSPLIFRILFSFIKFIAPSVPLFCDFVRLSWSSPPKTLISSIYVQYLYMANIARSMFIFIYLLDFIFWTPFPQLFVACCAWIIGICFGAGKLSNIFLSPKFYFREFNPFYSVFSYCYCTYVLPLLNLYSVYFWCDLLIVFPLLFLIIPYILVVLNLIGLLYFFIILICDIIIDCYVFLVNNILIGWDFIA